MSIPHPLRILLWAPKGSGEHYEGNGMFFYRLFSKTAPEEFQITLAHGMPSHGVYPRFAAQHLIANYTAGFANTWNFLRQSRRWLKAHAHEFDVFFGLAAYHNTVAPAAFAQSLGLPAVILLANHRLELVDKPGLVGLLKLPKKRREIMRTLDGVIAYSRVMQEEMREYNVPESRLFPIPAAADTDRFHPAAPGEREELRRRFGWADLPVFLFVGGVTARKRPHLMLEAVAMAKKQNVDFQLVLVGPEHDAAYAAEMRRAAIALGVESRVVWFGFTKDIAPMFRSADVFGLISENEGMSAALLQAMSSGIPSIVTNISGSSDLIADQVHGRVIEPTAENVTAAMVQYLKNPELAAKHGQAARDRIVESYSETAVLNRYRTMFETILQRRNGSAAKPQK